MLVCAIGCGGNPASGHPELTRRDPEPAGRNCARGGIAISTGFDLDDDGVLDYEEVLDVEYECRSGGVTLMREEQVAPSLDCPAGGIAVVSGIDEDGDGVLDDNEIDQTALQCASLALWRGDFTAADWMEPVKVAALRGAVTVEGSLTITTTGAVALPLLESVRGALIARGPMSELVLDRLREITGDVIVDAEALRRVSFAALERIGGALSIEHNAGREVALLARSLRTLGGRLALATTAGGAIVLPALRTASAVVLEGPLTDLQLDALAAVAGDVVVTDFDGALTLPALVTIDGTLRVENRGGPDISLPVLERLGADLRIQRLSRLKTLALPALREIAGDLILRSVDALATLDLAVLEDVRGIVQIEIADSLSTLGAPKLRTVGPDRPGIPSVALVLTGLQTLELGALTTAESLLIRGNAELRAIRLPALTQAEDITVDQAPSLAVLAAPALAALDRLSLVSMPALRTIDFDSLLTLQFLQLFECSLADLSGLRAVVSAGLISLTRADGLTDLRALASLRTLRALTVHDNFALTSLTGLDALTTIRGSVSIADNPRLTSLAGLRNVTSFAGSFTLTNNATLPTVTLTSLASITTNLLIAGNPALTTLAGLDALASVGGDVRVTDNDRIPAAEVAAFEARFRR